MSCAGERPDGGGEGERERAVETRLGRRKGPGAGEEQFRESDDRARRGGDSIIATRPNVDGKMSGKKAHSRCECDFFAMSCFGASGGWIAIQGCSERGRGSREGAKRIKLRERCVDTGSGSPALERALPPDNHHHPFPRSPLSSFHHQYRFASSEPQPAFPNLLVFAFLLSAHGCPYVFASFSRHFHK